MTIRLLRPFNGLPQNAIVDLDRATEAALVNARSATFTTTGGVTLEFPDPFDIPDWAGTTPIALPPKFTVLSRDAQQRVTSYITPELITYSVTYHPDSFGIQTISGGGQVTTVTYDVSGLVTSVETV